MSYTIDIYSRRSLGRALEKLKTPDLFMTNRFIKNKDSHDTSTIDIEIVEGAERLAQFIPDGGDPLLVAKAKKKIQTIKIPGTGEYKLFTVQEIKNFTNLGNVYNANPTAQAERIAALNRMKLREINDLKFRVQRLREWMTCQAFDKGKIEVTQDNIAFKLDFNFITGTHLITLTGTDKWTDSNSDPIKNIRTWKTAIMRRFGFNATDLVLGESAAEAFIKHAKVIEFLKANNLRVGAIDLTQKNEAFGIKIADNFLGLSIWEYNQQYKDKDDNAKDMITPTKAIMTSFYANNILHTGPIDYLDENGNAITELVEFFLFPEVMPQGSKLKSKLKWTLMQKSIVQVDPDAIISATVV